MAYLDDENNVRIYIKDPLKDLFYQLDDMRYVLYFLIYFPKTIKN